MKNAKTLIKIDGWFFIIIINIFLSVIGFFTAIASAKIERHDNPIIYSLPLSVFIWILFGLFAKVPDRNYTEENSLPEPKRICPFIVQVIVKIFIFIIMAFLLFIIIANFVLVFVIAFKEGVAPLFPS